ncbi:MAG: hypothetical protein HYU44_07085 [Betaproteobacteria bacterium]|nr:hypothetical protein [Betaproteobacteria bacterium]MBI2294423.1 hypothetical protein [Betaproteobacteria bacterium]MBI3055557.1 hypothetical protein [Betaproteobacteria bacterium]
MPPREQARDRQRSRKPARRIDHAQQFQPFGLFLREPRYDLRRCFGVNCTPNGGNDVAAYGFQVMHAGASNLNMPCTVSANFRA